ncbi:MAG: universal stress protein [Desulfomonile tiedjei]|nr:universal stress protein [Desulfomonile tiedjei]
MKRTKRKITALLNAITFAEAGDHETAREYLQELSESAEGEPGEIRTGASAQVHKKGLSEKVRDHMAAVAFAEAGETRVAESMVHAEPKPQSVLLVIDGDAPDSNAIGYAVSLCKRMSLEMEILHVIAGPKKKSRSGSSGPADERAAERIQELSKQMEREGIPFKTAIRTGDANQLLYDYANRHKEVFLVIYDSPRARGNSAEGKVWQRIVDGISRRLSIPLVTVMGKQSSA